LLASYFHDLLNFFIKLAFGVNLYIFLFLIKYVEIYEIIQAKMIITHINGKNSVLNIFINFLLVVKTIKNPPIKKINISLISE
jgi:hypothetical protein